ncbi:MAG: oligosaccharide flippase family protein [Candidatus Micrarchaeota archaeon]|nr:oligosaccharide flippase family protein [Candidatus Micrarchaeota archaeon]
MVELNSDHKTIVKGTFWGIAGATALKLISFVYTIIIARFFLPEQVGTFYLSLSLMYLIAIFGDLGIGNAMGRFVPYFMGKGEKQKVFSLLKASYLYTAILSAILSIGLFISAGFLAVYFKNPDLERAVQYISIFLFINPFFGINSAFINGLKKFRENQFIFNLQNLLKLIILLLMFFYLGSNEAVIPISFIVSFVIATLISFIFIKKANDELDIKETHLSFKEQFTLLSEIIPFGLTVSLIASFWVIATYVDRILLGIYLPAQDAAVNISIYTIAIALSGIVTVFAGALGGIIGPIISELFGKGSHDQMKKVSSSTLRWMVFLSAPTAITLLIFPGEMLTMFYGTAYASGAIVLSMFTVATLMRMLGNIQTTILTSYNLLKVELSASVISTIINIIICIFLIPKYGISGAAVAFIISSFTITILMNYYCKKLAGFGFSKEIIKPLAAGVMAFIFFFYLKAYFIAILSSASPIPSVENEILQLIFQKVYKLAVLGVIFIFISMVYILSLIVIGGVHSEDKELTTVIFKRIQTTLGLYKGSS